MPQFILQSCLIFVFCLSACSAPSTTVTQVPSMDQVTPIELVGRVVDDGGVPVINANVKTSSAVSATDSDGWFHIPSKGYAQWISIYKAGYISRTRAAAPGDPVLIRVSQDDGKTIVLKFTGDVMFGRRFFDMNSDGDPEDGILPTHPSVGDQLSLLGPIAPLLKDSDITAINLESVVDTQPYFSSKDPRPMTFHPTKDYVYATDPTALAALMKDGVNVIGLGNNHVYDMLDPGMANTIGFLNKLGLSHFGAGMNEAEAWAPAFVTIKGQRIAFIGCTTIFASGAVAKPNEIIYVASDAEHKGGAAHCEKNKLRTAIMEAKRRSDLVIVMIHGGVEYDRNLPGGPLHLSEIAKQAGASIVVNHHPHVVSGFSWKDGKIIDRSLGNFISDQTIWPSLESYLFTVYVRDGNIIRAFIEPVLLQDNVARGVTGDLADYVAREATGLEADPFIVESDTMVVDVNHTAKQASRSFDLDGGSGMLIQIPDAQWISNFTGSGKLLLGRDLLWVGGFENNVVGDSPNFIPLWTQANTSSVQVGSQFAYEGQAGIRLSRLNTNEQDVITTNIHRILTKPESHITISGMYRVGSGANASVQVSWYPDTIGPSSDQVIQPLDNTNYGTWQHFQLDVQVPAKAIAFQVFLKLSPPATGTATVDFDNLRAIEWAPEKTKFSALYNFAYLTGMGTLTLSQSILPGGEQWMTVSNTDISKFIVGQQAP